MFRGTPHLAIDRITYLLVAVLCVQLVELLELGLTGLVLFLVVGLFVTALFRADTATRRSRR